MRKVYLLAAAFVMQGAAGLEPRNAVAPPTPFVAEEVGKAVELHFAGVASGAGLKPTDVKALVSFVLTADGSMMKGTWKSPDGRKGEAGVSIYKSRGSIQLKGYFAGMDATANMWRAHIVRKDGVYSTAMAEDNLAAELHGQVVQEEFLPSSFMMRGNHGVFVLSKSDDRLYGKWLSDKEEGVVSGVLKGDGKCVLLIVHSVQGSPHCTLAEMTMLLSEGEYIATDWRLHITKDMELTKMLQESLE